MSKQSKKRKAKNQPATKSLPVSRPSPLPANFPGGLKAELLSLFLILAAFAALTFNSFRQESVTVDEFAHLPVGFSFLKTRDFRLDPYSPPFLRMFAALPLIWSDVKFPEKVGWNTSDHWGGAIGFMYENMDSYHSIFLRGRVMILLLGMMLVALTWWWARSLYGSKSGIFAAALSAFCPNIMAHSGLVTTDIGASLTIIAAIYGFWAFCRKPNLGRGISLGLLLGIALLCKFTSLVLILLMAGLGMAYFWGRSRGLNWKAIGRNIAVALTVSWLLVNSGYLWKGFGTRISGYQFSSRMFSNLSKILPEWTPIPLAYDYVGGFDLQSAQNEGGHLCYLLGEFSGKGWKYYFLVALAVKMTIASLILILAGIYSLTFSGKLWRDELFLLVPAVTVIGTLSLMVHLDLGFRYILPAIPFLYIFASRLVSPLLNPKSWMQSAIWLLLLGHIISNLLIYPDYLAYFNLASGGPKNGRKILIDSNLDWGQDLISLKKYMDRNGLEHLCLAYFGRVDPRVYGIDYELPFKGGSCDQVAVSATLLVGFPYFLVNNDSVILIDPGQFDWLKNEQPKASIGYSILLFDLKENILYKNGTAGIDPKMTRLIYRMQRAE